MKRRSDVLSHFGQPRGSYLSQGSLAGDADLGLLPARLMWLWFVDWSDAEDVARAASELSVEDRRLIPFRLLRRIADARPDHSAARSA